MKSLRLLLIEDSEDDALLLELELRNAGFDLVFARVDTPQELEAALAENSWDAIIADYNLPAFTGLDALRIIQAKGLDLPFILVSGVIGEEKAVEAMKAGAHDYLMKGNFSRLAPALERELRDAEVRRERRQALEDLQRAHDELENRVGQRTDELSRANEVLRAEIAERERTEQALLQATVAAEAASRAKSQFLANMSHELRTPMTGVLGMLDLALAGDLAAEQRDFIETARTSALSLVRILNDILDLTKIEAGKFSIEAKPFSIRNIVKNTFNILLPVTMSKGLDFDFIIADDVPDTLVGDQTRLSQVLTNLAGNAVKFTEKGRVEIRVATGGSAPVGTRDITFTVSDTGIGIPDDKKDLLFRVFSQVDESHTRSYGGIGLGLAICKEIVARLGGTITFSSEAGQGSTFSFTLPLGAAKAEQGAIAAGKTTTSGEAPRAEGISKPRLLVAEDDQINRKALGLMLQMADFAIDFAEDGQQAVEMWEEGEYDLILMDIQMPRLNGIEATGVIREKERTRGGHTPIVAVTAHALKEDEKRCLDAGMDAFVAKPIDFKACIQVIREALKKTGIDR